jgi:L-malate glycosyltransferase
LTIALCTPADVHSLARSLNRGSEGVAPGLGSTAVTPLIVELVRRGHSVTLYTLSNDLEQEQFHQWDNLRVFIGPSRSFGSPRDFYRTEINYLTRIIRRDAPAFVHAHWTYEFALGALNSGVPTLTTIHDLPWNVMRYYRDRCRAVRLLLAYMVASKGRHFTAVSPDAASHFRRWLRPGASITVIPNFLRSSVFEISKSRPRNPEKPFTFVTATQGWTRLKNATCALQAFQIARQSLQNAQLLMIGTDYEPDGPANRWAIEHGLSKGVTFCGAMPNNALLEFVEREADALVHPSLNEAFSVAVAECMALRKPVIAGKYTTGMKWALDDGRCGLLVDVRDPEMVATAMKTVATDGTLRLNLSEAAFARAWNLFRADVVVPQYEAVYRTFENQQTKDAWKRDERRGVA